jgi:beta-galactosidase
LTVTAWVNTSVTSDYQSRVVSKGLNANNRDNFGLFVNENDTAGFYARDSNETIYFCGSDEQIPPGEWHHIAGSYDGSALNCYVDGRLDNSEDEIGEATLLQDTNDLAIGNMVDADRAYIGKVDDVQFYDYALSVDQVAYLGTEGTGNMSLTSEANLYDLEPAGQKAINIKDAAVLLEHWLEQKLWPQ